MRNRIVLLAPAKLNLTLEVLGKRPDGYHEIRTLMLAVDLYDRIDLRRMVVPNSTPHEKWGSAPSRRPRTRKSPAIRLEVRGHRVPAGPRNLAWRAAEAVLRESGRDDAIAIRLEKRIPPGSGLGGGSSDAAAVLRGLDRLLRLRIPSAKLRRIAASIGSDVPFFLGDESLAVASGRGESVRSLSAARPVWFVVLFPGVALSTASVYAGARIPLTRQKRPLSVIAGDLRLHRIRTLRETLFNQLETSATRLQPRVGSVLRRLRARNLPFHLTGSGSAVFLPCVSRREAEFVRTTLLRWGSHRVVRVRSLTGRPIREERRRGGGDHGGTHQAAGRQG